MTLAETITDIGQLADIAYLPYGTAIKKGDVYFHDVTLYDKDGKPKSYYLKSNYTVIDYASISGLSNAGKLFRTGYFSHEDVGDDKEWTTFPDKTPKEPINGTYENLLKYNKPVDLLGNKYDNILKGANDNDYLDGGGGDDVLIGNGGEDTIIGGAGDDVLIGTDGYGNDDAVQDILSGGANFDTYIVGGGDVIEDSDNEGLIIFKGIDLTGVKTKV